MKTQSGQRILQICAILLFGSVCIASWSYPPKARWIPLIIATTGLLIALVDFYMPAHKDENDKEAPPTAGVPPRKELVVWLWVGVLFLLVVSFGLIIGSAVFLAVFLKYFWKEKWKSIVIKVY